MPTLPNSLHDLEGFVPIVGAEYTSRWFQVAQEQVDAFSAATGDNQRIHQLDSETNNSPFGGPVAHGLLLLSLGISLARQSRALPDATWLLYGFERIRFRAPVRNGTRVRCSTTVQGTRTVGSRTLVDIRLVMEIEDQRIPAFVADCLLLKL